MAGNTTLSGKRLRFVDEYCVDQNATQAAARAGYSAKSAYSQGQRLLKNAEIRAAIDVRISEIAGETGINAATVLQGLLTEAQRTGEGSSHSARVTAWAKLGDHLSLFKDQQAAATDRQTDAINAFLAEMGKRGTKIPVKPSDPETGG